MRQLNHPNLLPLYCSFVHKEHLWMVMPYVQGGSVLNIMRFAYPDVSGLLGCGGVYVAGRQRARHRAVSIHPGVSGG